MKVRTSNRRNFFFTLSKRISAIVIAIIFPSLKLQGAHLQRRNQNDPDTWFDNIKGKHKIVFDSIGANDGIQIVWAHTFLSTNNQLGIADSDLGVMLVFRNKAIALAMQHG